MPPRSIDFISSSELDIELYSFDDEFGNTVFHQDITYKSPTYLDLLKNVLQDTFLEFPDLTAGLAFGEGLAGFRVDGIRDNQTGHWTIEFALSVEGVGVDLTIETNEYFVPISVVDGFVGGQLILGDQGQVLGYTFGNKGLGQLGIWIDSEGVSFGAEFDVSLGLYFFGSLDANASAKVEVYNFTSGLPDLLPNCFASGTPIKMADGSDRSIEKIVAGDEVLAFGSIGNPRSARVLRSFTNDVNEVVELSSGIQVTPSHRFLTEHNNYLPIEEMIAAGEPVVMADGSLQPVHIERRINAADTAPAFDGNLALKPVSSGIPVYNFEVERFHNYIAGGMRVHNDCIEPGDTVFAHKINDDGTINFFINNSNSGVTTKLTEIDIGNGLVQIQKQEFFVDSGVKVKTNQDYDPVTGEAVGDRDVKLELADPNAAIGRPIGEIFGSTLGKAIAGDNIFAQIAAGSVLATILGSFGEGLEFFFNKDLDTDPGQPGVQNASFEEALESGFDEFDVNFFAQLKAQGTKALSSFLAAELAEAIGVDGFGGAALEYGISFEDDLATRRRETGGVISIASFSGPAPQVALAA